MYPATITSQWQMSIPAPVRRALRGKKRVLVYENDDGLIIKPVKDFLELSGSLKTNKKPLTNSQLHKLFAKVMTLDAIK